MGGLMDSYADAVRQGTPEAYYPALREAGGIVYDEERNMYVVGDYAGARQALSDPDGTSFLKDLAVVPWWLFTPHANPAAAEVMGTFTGYPGAIVGEVGQRHLDRRRIVGAAMNQAATGLRNTRIIDETVARHVDRARTWARSVPGEPFDLQADLIEPVALDLLGQRLDLPREMKDLVAATATAQADFTWPADPPPYEDQPDLAKSLIAMRDMCADLIDDHLAGASRPDSATAHLVRAVGAGRLTREEAIANLFGLVNASYATTAGTVTRYLDHLLRSGGWAAVDPASPRFAHEVAQGLAVWTGVHGWMRRTADGGARLADGRRLERGAAYVLVLIEAANQDPDRGDDVLLSFSPAGQHRCLGENEAVRTAVSIVSALRAVFPRIQVHGEPERRANLAFRTQAHLSVLLDA